MDLKDSADLQRFILNGRVFHSSGPTKEKARSPCVLRCQQGCISSCLSDERNVLDGLKWSPWANGKVTVVYRVITLYRSSLQKI